MAGQMQLMARPDGITSGAALSNDADGLNYQPRYRYRLVRHWALTPRPIVWVMLNPSTADGLVDDATIRRCIAFTRTWGYGALTVVNLYAYRATDPKAMWAARAAGVDIIGPHNDAELSQAMADARFVVAAWGANAEPSRAFHVSTLAGQQMVCLGQTKAGQPRHPLYVKGDTQLTRWN